MKYTKQDIFHSLEEMNAPRNGVVLAHTSLRLVGDVEGGAQGLLDALVSYFTDCGGLLCIPTHTWNNFGDPEKYTLDMTSDENSLGAFSTVAIRDKRGVRSENPTHSMVVFGDRERALSLIADDALVKTPTAPESAYGKLYSMGGHVLLIGVSQTKNTYLHSVAEMLELPNRMDRAAKEVSVRRSSGEVVLRELTLYDCDYSSDISARFSRYETAFRYHRAICDGWIGDAPTQLCDAVKMKEIVALIWERAGGEDPLCGEASIPPKWYFR